MKLKASEVSKIGRSHSFGLPPITTCPRSTKLCREKCYARNTLQRWSKVNSVLNDNERIVRSLLKTGRGRMELIRQLSSLVGKRKEFRIHWSGDFFDGLYARCWQQVILPHPETSFWTYTRSFGYIYRFISRPNMRLYLSLDRENWKKGLDAWWESPWTYLSTMGLEGEPRILGEILHVVKSRTRALSLKVFDCPAVKGPLHGVRYACAKCRVCVDSKSRNVVNFPIHR